MNTNANTTYEIKLPQFEGPFDLLLFFIERDEIDIYDIPIAKLTNDFLDYIHQMEILNIDLASEFILVAATLMRIKAKMLLPRKEINEEGEEIDPREELVRHLLEYKKFKAVIDDLKSLEEARILRFTRGYTEKEIKVIADKYSSEAELESLSLFCLLKVFHRVLERMEDRDNKVQFSVVKHPYTIQQQKDHLLGFLRDKKNVAFENVFQDCTNRIQAVFRFLSILELMNEKMIFLRLGLGMNNFWLSSRIDMEEEELNILAAEEEKTKDQIEKRENEEEQELENYQRKVTARYLKKQKEKESQKRKEKQKEKNVQIETGDESNALNQHEEE